MTDFVPAGDPEGMRATARALLATADGVRLAPEGAVAGLEALVLEGPAAERLLAAGVEVRSQAEQAAGDLEAVAAALQADATRVEQMNEALRIAAVQATERAAQAATQSATQAAAAAAQTVLPPPATPAPAPAPVPASPVAEPPQPNAAPPAA